MSKRTPSPPFSCTHISLFGDTINVGLNKVNVKVQSDFYPIQSRTSGMNRFQKCVERDLVQLATASHTSMTHIDNLTSQDRSALRNLHSDSSIVIWNLDKGGLVVVMDASTYRDEAV